MNIGYARVSTNDQNLHLQLDALNKAGCEKIFTDEMTGSKMDRPGLDAALAYLREGDRLIIWKIDRIGRNSRGVLAFVDEIEAKGCFLSSITEGGGTGTPTEKFFLAMLTAFAELERGNLIERTNAGLAAARARGRFGGRPRKLSPQQEKGLLAMLANPENSISEIAEAFGLSRTSVYTYLKRNNR
ncbi:recombinase family protein, partial [Ancylothrix sp. C2]|uniref:recombinase family protein n=1 Tax=Ancylothrix sp. D3o TaxID=2953691 RepID=UPI0021BB22E8